MSVIPRVKRQTNIYSKGKEECLYFLREFITKWNKNIAVGEIEVPETFMY